MIDFFLAVLFFLGGMHAGYLLWLGIIPQLLTGAAASILGPAIVRKIAGKVLASRTPVGSDRRKHKEGE